MRILAMESPVSAENRDAEHAAIERDDAAQSDSAIDQHDTVNHTGYASDPEPSDRKRASSSSNDDHRGKRSRSMFHNAEALGPANLFAPVADQNLWADGTTKFDVYIWDYLHRRGY